MSLIAVRHATCEAAQTRITSLKTEIGTETTTGEMTSVMIDAVTIKGEMIDETIAGTAGANAVGQEITVMGEADKGHQIVVTSITAQAAISNRVVQAILSAKALTDIRRTMRTKTEAALVKSAKLSKNPRMFI